jgi:pseudouridine synthase
MPIALPSRNMPPRPRNKPRKKTRPGVPPALTDKSRGERIQRVLADAGIASRRACEQMIEQGRVRVNGQLVTALPAWVDPHADRIEVDGQIVPGSGKKTRDKTGPPRHYYVMLNKPRHVISTTRDTHGRKDVTDLVQLPAAPGKKPPRLFPVGRLDADSTGLMLLTNDGDLANRLTHPRYGVPKQYRVSVRGRVSDQDIEQLKQGLYLAQEGPRGKTGKKARITELTKIGHQRGKDGEERTELMVTLREGQNREIRRLLARLGHKARRLHRVSIGPLKLKGVAVGEWRMLTIKEVGMLRKAAGEK